MLIPQFKFKRKTKSRPQPSKPNEARKEVIVPAKSSVINHHIGLRVLHEPNTGTASNIVNIVFVHGLGGSATETWTHAASKTFWPSLLHDDRRFANARISTFGYDANFQKIFAPKCMLGISDFATQLLDGLDLHYEEYNDVSMI